MNNGIKLLIYCVFIFLTSSIFADEVLNSNRGTINSLCRNLVIACLNGEVSSCQAAQNTGCKCDDNLDVCSRGNYSKE